MKITIPLRRSFSLRDILVQALVAVIEVGPQRISLAFPEGIGSVVILEDQPEYFGDALFHQRVFRPLDKRAGDAMTPIVRMDAHVMNDRTPSVMTCQNDSGDPAFIRIIISQKASCGIPLQISFDPFATVIHGIQSTL